MAKAGDRIIITGMPSNYSNTGRNTFKGIPIENLIGKAALVKNISKAYEEYALWFDEFYDLLPGCIRYGGIAGNNIPIGYGLYVCRRDFEFIIVTKKQQLEFAF